jgi:hypothetical protein
LTTGPVPVSSGQTAYCGAVNVTSKPVDVRVKLIDRTGFNTGGPHCVIEPGAECFLSSAGSGTTSYSCRITTNKGKNSVRGSLHNVTTGLSSDAR